MKLNEFEEYMIKIFDTSNHDLFDQESGVTVQGKEEIKKIGYCTNLTLDTVEEAKSKKVDLMITHHDAWDFIFGLKKPVEKNF